MKTLKNYSVQALAAMMIVITIFCSANIPTYAANTVDYSIVFDATYYADKYQDLKSAFGYNEAQLLNHFISSGMKEGRQANEEFNVQAYRFRYADLRTAFGDDLKAYYMHYITVGKAEGRNARPTAVTTVTNTQASNSTATSTANAYWSTIILDAIDAAGVLPTDSAYTKAVKISDYVCKAANYSEGNNPHNADWYGVLVMHDAICAGYASAIADMCRAVGVDAYCLTGSGKSSNHGWNVYFIDGNTYYADACWADLDGELYPYKLAYRSDGVTTYWRYKHVREIKELHSAATFREWGYEFVEDTYTEVDYRYTMISVPNVPDITSSYYVYYR